MAGDRDIYMQELAVRAIIDDIAAENTLLRKTSETGGRLYEAATVGTNLEWGTGPSLRVTDYPVFVSVNAQYHQWTDGGSAAPMRVRVYGDSAATGGISSLLIGAYDSNVFPSERVYIRIDPALDAVQIDRSALLGNASDGDLFIGVNPTSGPTYGGSLELAATATEGAASNEAAGVLLAGVDDFGAATVWCGDVAGALVRLQAGALTLDVEYGTAAITATECSTLSVLAAEGAECVLQLFADQGDDAIDKWKITARKDSASKAVLSFENYDGSSWEYGMAFVKVDGYTGLAVRMRAEETIYHGDIVKCSNSNTARAQYVRAGDNMPIGVAVTDGASVSAGSYFWCIVSGFAWVNMQSNITATRGYMLYVSTTDDAVANQTNSPGTGTTHWAEIGHVAKTAAEAGDPTLAILHFN